MDKTIQLINRESLKAVMKEKGVSYSEAARYLNITPTGFCFKMNGRKGRAHCPFTETEIQIMRAMFGDSILNPAPEAGKRSISE